MKELLKWQQTSCKHKTFSLAAAGGGQIVGKMLDKPEVLWENRAQRKERSSPRPKQGPGRSHHPWMRSSDVENSQNRGLFLLWPLRCLRRRGGVWDEGRMECGGEGI